MMDESLEQNKTKQNITQQPQPSKEDSESVGVHVDASVSVFENAERQLRHRIQQGCFDANGGTNRQVSNRVFQMIQHLLHPFSFIL